MIKNSNQNYFVIESSDNKQFFFLIEEKRKGKKRKKKIPILKFPATVTKNINCLFKNVCCMYLNINSYVYTYIRTFVH